MIKIYAAASDSWKTRIRSTLMASSYYNLYRNAVRKLRSLKPSGLWESWELSGTESSSGLQMKIAYAGTRQNRNYIAKTIFSGCKMEASSGTLSSEELSRKAVKSGCDAIIFEVNAQNRSFLPGSVYFRIPIWTPLKLELNDNPTLLQSRKFLAENRRYLRKHSVSYTVTREEKKLSEFYTRLYVPFTSFTHQSEAFIHPYHDILKRFENAELLIACHEGEMTGGLIIEYSGNEGRLSFMGVQSQWIKDGIISALLYQAVLRIRHKKLERANLGDSRGFLKDGSFHFKARWGGKVFPQDPRSENFWTFRPLKNSAALAHCLIEHPFISINDNGIPEAVFFTPRPVHELTKDRGFTDLLCDGLNVANIYTCSPTEIDFENHIPVPFDCGIHPIPDREDPAVS